MKIRFRSNQGHAERGFKMGQEYEMDDKSAQHWISKGLAVAVTDDAARTRAGAAQPAAQPRPAPQQENR